MRTKREEPGYLVRQTCEVGRTARVGAGAGVVLDAFVKATRGNKREGDGPAMMLLRAEAALVSRQMRGIVEVKKKK